MKATALWKTPFLSPWSQDVEKKFKIFRIIGQKRLINSEKTGKIDPKICGQVSDPSLGHLNNRQLLICPSTVVQNFFRKECKCNLEDFWAFRNRILRRILWRISGRVRDCVEVTRKRAESRRQKYLPFSLFVLSKYSFNFHESLSSLVDTSNQSLINRSFWRIYVQYHYCQFSQDLRSPSMWSEMSYEDLRLQFYLKWWRLS